MKSFFKKASVLFLGAFLSIGVGVGALFKNNAVKTDATGDTYSFTIKYTDLNTGGYAAGSGSYTSTATCTTDNTKTLDVSWTSADVYQNSKKMQWKKTTGNIYNTTDLGTINSVTITCDSNTFTTYYGTSQKPTSGTTVGNGYFSIKNGTGGAGYSTEITVNFTKTVKSLSKIEVTTAPTKVTYTEGELFDPTGMVVTATYSDSTTEDITSKCTVTPTTALKLTDTSITISYDKKEITYPITVNEIPVDHYDVVGTLIGNTLTNEWDFSGLTLKAYTSEDDSTEKKLTAPVTFDCDYTPDQVEDTTDVSVEYNGSFIGYFTVNASISASKTVSKTSFDATSGALDENISFKAEQGSAATAPATGDNMIRVYQNGGTFTVSVKTGNIISSISLGSGMATSVKYSIDGGSDSATQSIAQNKTLDLNGIRVTSSIKFTCVGTDKNSRLYVNNLSVTYEVLTYTKPVTSISDIALTQNSVAINAINKNELTASATVNPADTDEPVIWTSSDESVATVTASGTIGNAKITLVGQGSCTFTLSNVSGSITKTSVTFTVTAPVEPEVIDNCSVSDVLDNNLGNGAVKMNVTGVISAWYSTNTDATASGSYILKDLTDSSKTIIVYKSSADSSMISWDGDQTKYVYSDIDDFLTNEATKDLAIGDKVTLTAIRADYYSTKEIVGVVTSSVKNELTGITVTNNHAADYTSVEDIANADFTVTAHYTVAGDVAIDSASCTVNHDNFTESGSYTITVSYGGKSASYDVNVVKVEVHITDIAVASETISVPNEEQSDFGVTVTPASNSFNLTYTITSGSDVISIDQATGVFTALKTGTAVVSIGTDDPNYTATKTVTVTVYKNIKYTITDNINVKSFSNLGTSYTTDFTCTTAFGVVFGGRTCSNASAGTEELPAFQVNKANGYLFTKTTIGVAKSVTVDFYNANSNTLTVYGSNEAFTAVGDQNTKGTSVGSLKANGTIDITDDYQYLYFYGSGAMYLKSINIAWEKQATSALASSVDAFVNDALFMNNAEYSGVKSPETASCSDNYQAFITAYNALSVEEKAIFGQASCYADARARATAWASANGVNATFDSANNYVWTASSVRTSFVAKEQQNTYIALIVVLSLIGFTSLVVIKKKFSK